WYFEENLFVLDTPIFYWEVIKRPMAVGSTGISPSRGSLATAPIACDGFTVEIPLITLGLWLDGSIVSPIACRRRGGSHPPVIADCISLPAMQIVAQSLMWLMLSQWQ
ncbi:hypothetical protein, partial [Ruminococcus champanellensis]|uniref:hypothetical protein n=1 Tax=Ruminococcus champanellensis TaxID=1161942 RepID=UPI003AB5C66D